MNTPVIARVIFLNSNTAVFRCASELGIVEDLTIHKGSTPVFAEVGGRLNSTWGMYCYANGYGWTHFEVGNYLKLTLL